MKNAKYTGMRMQQIMGLGDDCDVKDTTILADITIANGVSMCLDLPCPIIDGKAYETKIMLNAY